MEEEETVLHFLSSSFPPSSSLHALKVNRAHQTEKRKEGKGAYTQIRWGRRRREGGRDRVHQT